MNGIIEKVQMSTLVSCMNALFESGYKVQFIATPKGLKSLATEKTYQPEDVKIVNFYRFEGESDPSDNSILYAIEAGDEKGTLTDGYGASSDENVTKFLKEIEDIHKKT
jgi:hypothetical protein